MNIMSKPEDYSPEKYFGPATRPDGLTFGYTPYAPQSQWNDSNKLTRACYDSYMIEYRYLDSWTANTETQLWGETFASPIMTGGVSAVVPLLHPNGMVEIAKGAAKFNTPSLYGYITNKEVEDLVATGNKVIRIVKTQLDNQAILDDIKHDEEAGCFAFAMDIDHGIDHFGNLYHATPDYGTLAPKKTEDIALLCESTKLPCILKGVLSVSDAKKAAEAGAAAVLLSHHKGEIENAVPPLFVLPEIKEAVGDKIKIFVDCGIVSGIDAYKALALGADGVCVARKLVKPYMEKGADGVYEQLTEQNNELKCIMGRTGTLDVKHFDPTTLRKRNF